MLQLFAGSAAYPTRTGPDDPGPVLTIGNFDGVHRGHQHLLDRLVTRARALGAPSCVYTFEPPPRVVLAPQQHRPRILAWTDKLRLLHEHGVDQVVVDRFTRAFAQHPPEWFANEILGVRLRASALVVGYDFRFGKARAGDLPLLRQLLPQVPVEQVQAWTADEGVISSSAVRGLVAEGQVEQAARLLGRPHSICGTVIAGDQRGRTIGFPTANLETDAELLPANGVYVVRARVNSGDWLPAVANLGTRPTFQGQRTQVEVHLLDMSMDLYGHELTVAFEARLRDERRFSGVDALVAQIREDVAAARVLLGAPVRP